MYKIHNVCCPPQVPTWVLNELDIAKRPSIGSQLSTIALPAPSLTPSHPDISTLSPPYPDAPTQLPPPVRAFAATPMERKDMLLGKQQQAVNSQQQHSPATKRQVSLPKVQVAPIRIPKRLASASSYNDLPKSNHGNRPHPQPNPILLKKSQSNADVASGPVAKQHTSPIIVRKQSRPRPPSISSGCGSESDLTSPVHLSSSSDGEVCV